MKFRTPHCGLLLFCIIYEVVQGDIGDVHIVLKHWLVKCLTGSNSLQTNYAQLLQCTESSGYVCSRFHKPLGNLHKTEMGGVCGVISPGQLIRSYVWDITVHSQFSLIINFTHFHLPLTKGCNRAYVVMKIPGVPLEMVRKSKYNNAPTEPLYCGYRVPWSQSFPQSHASITFFTEQKLSKGYNFVLTFEAFDAKLPSVGLVHSGEHYYTYGDYNFTMAFLTRNTFLASSKLNSRFTF